VVVSQQSEGAFVNTDPSWPSAANLLTNNSGARVALIGIPAHQTSISATRADTTPPAVREALNRYSTFCATHDQELLGLEVFDAGNVKAPDHPAGEARVHEKLAELSDKFVIAIGGDNSITYSVATGLWGNEIGRAGLITFDAHHDLRDGISNGSPVQRLVQAGLSGKRIVQIGIADFSNSPQYAQRAKEYGITVIPRSELRTRTAESIVEQAISIAGALGGPMHVDFDVDVCDRSVVPGCPAAAPGGISADEFRNFAHLIGASNQVHSVDFTEVDAQADAPDGRTVRLVAVSVLELLCGLRMSRE
jgi:formiminoglutamase